MMRSLFSGVAGLKNHQTRMDVVGNNIANVNTAGYKAARTTFSDMLSQNIKGAASATGNRGGVNPLQVGLGMGLASVDNIFTSGSLQSTGKNTDLAIDGDGFFIVGSGLERYYTRAGNFDFDAIGNYVIPGTGLMVMGWVADENGVINNSTQPAGIQIPLSRLMPPKPTSEMSFVGNLKAYNSNDFPNTADGLNNLISAVQFTTLPVYDSLGVAHNASIIFRKFDPAVNDPPADVSEALPNNVWHFTYDVAGTTGGPYTGTLTFGADGKLIAPPAGPFTFTPDNGADFGPTSAITPDFSTITQMGIESTATLDKSDGYTAGMLNRATLTVDSTGVIFGLFSNGQQQSLGQVAMATFTNPGGLTKVGTSLFLQSNNSGVPNIGIATEGGRGEIKPSTLEMSNVDLSEEFTAMITTQRGFQANSRIITVSDTMIEELVNLKR